jgi:hypothetical protein
MSMDFTICYFLRLNLSTQVIVFLHVCAICASCVKKINAKDAIVATVNKTISTCPEFIEGYS